MKIRIAAIIFSVALIVQGTLLNLISIGGVTPNLILCLVIVFTFLYENNYGIYFGLVFGFISDFCYSDVFGVASLGYLIVVLFIIKIRPIFNKENLLSVFIYGISGTIIYNGFYWCLIKLFDMGIDFTGFMKIQPLYIIYNLFFLIIIYYTLINKVISHRSDRYYR